MVTMKKTEHVYEKPHLSNSKEDVLSWPLEAQARMEYTVSSPNLGFVDFIQPYKYLAGDCDPNQPEDLDASQETVKTG